MILLKFDEIRRYFCINDFMYYCVDINGVGITCGNISIYVFDGVKFCRELMIKN